MNKRYDRIVLFVLSLIVFITTIMGLIIPNVYENRNNSITTFEINGQDIISLIVSLAFLVILSINKLYYSRKDVIIGFLVYFLYTYLFFSVGLIFSKIFVMYLFINTISLFCLINQIIIIYNEKLYLHKANKSISIYIFIIVFIVGIIDIKDIIIATVLSNVGFDTKKVFYVLDISLLFPTMIFAAIQNIKKTNLGNVLCGAFLIKTITLMPAIIISDFLHFINLGTFVDFTFDIIAFFIMVSATLFYIVFISNRKKNLTTAST